MTIWKKLRDRVAGLTGPLYNFFNEARAPEATEGFTIAVVALGAKMAKADGLVTRDEVVAFREIFHIADEDLSSVGRFFDLARRDTAGFELYAARISKMFEQGGDVLEALLDALFYIARADGVLQETEVEFLKIVADTFGFNELAFSKINARHATDSSSSPYAVLNVSIDASPEEIRVARAALAKRYHPDRLRALGVPDEAARLAERRMAEINAAYDALNQR